MQDNSFFDIPTEQSKVKARIVEKYFRAWADVIIGTENRVNKIGFVDFFAGPGKYADGYKSTPLLVLEKAIENEKIRDRLVSVFNDAESGYAKNLEESIRLTQGIDTLKYYPIVRNLKLGEEEDVSAQVFDPFKSIPTLFFVDPWGYKGLSLELISSSLKNWGCDCIFFFNYNRINMGINNPLVEEYMEALFGTESAKNLRTKIWAMSPSEREPAIVEEIGKSLKSEGGEYVQSFRFKAADGERSSHYLIFVSKDQTGHKIMKEIMAGESTYSQHGVPSFEYNSADNKQLLLFDPLDELAEMLLTEYAGRTMTMRQIFDDHNVGKPFILKNYRDVLVRLETDGKIQADRPANKRPKRKGKVTFAEDVKVTFPPKDE